MRDALVLVALCVLAGGAGIIWLLPVATLNLLSRLEAARVSTGHAYAPGPRHGIDVYLPPKTGMDRPVVVFFYGGGWEEGDRALYRFVGAALASRGIVTIIPDYRVYPDVRFPGFLQDGAQAVRWAHDHAAQFGGDASRLVLVGHSAGAHIAAMLAFDREWLAGVGLNATRDIAGMAGIAGPYDFLPLNSATLKDIFGSGQELPLSQPINHVMGGEAPVFLVSGTTDSIVDPGNSTRLAARIQAYGGEVETRFHARVSHASVLGAFARPLRLLAPVLDEITGFVRDRSSRRSVP